MEENIVTIDDKVKFKNLFGEIQQLQITNPDVLNSCDESSNDCSTQETILPNMDQVCKDMLDRVANSPAHFKHQQINEPDLSYAEKLRIAQDLLEKNPGIFLERFGKYLIQSDLSYFEKFPGDYVVEYRLKEIQKRIGNATSALKRVKNRRFEKMKRLIGQGEYFSDDEMKRRDPLLYEQMVGQYLTSDEIQSQAELATSDGNLSSVLLKHLQSMQNNELYERQVENQECGMEEQDEVDEDTEEEEEEMDSEHEIDDPDKISDKEKIRLRDEFLETMKQRFLDGKDSDFNYCDVDDNDEYDSYDLFNRDEEDRYFDEDEYDEEICSD